MCLKHDTASGDAISSVVSMGSNLIILPPFFVGLLGYLSASSKLLYYAMLYR